MSGPVPPLVGREADLARLSAALGLDPAGTAGGSAVLAGDAGIGKSRLLVEVSARARSRGWRVLLGRCLGEAGSTMPFLPFMELFAGLEREDPERSARLLESHPALSLFLGTGPAEGNPSRVLEAVRAALRQLAGDTPLLMVVEDVHWADRSSADLLSWLFTSPPGEGVSLVVSVRTDDLHRRHPLSPTLAHWSRLPGLARVALGPLPAEPMRRLVRAWGARPGDVDAVVARADGNAFFAEELTATAGLVGPGDDLSRLLGLRLNLLDEVAQQLVRLVAVAGRGTSHRLLARVAGLPDDALESALREAVERHVLVSLDDGYALRHSLLAEAVYDDLLPGERLRLHERIAAAITQDPSLGGPGALARHAFEAGDRPTALRAGVLAGDEAMSSAGPGEAYRHFLRALSLHPGPADLVSVTRRAGVAGIAAGRPREAVSLLQDLLARDVLTPRQRAELLGDLSVAAREIESDLDGVAITAQGLELVGAEPEDQLTARLLTLHAEALVDHGRHEEAVGFLHRAQILAGALGLSEIPAEVGAIVARSTERQGDSQLSGQMLERLVAEAGSPGQRMRALYHLGALYHRLGRLEEALAALLRARQLGIDLGRIWSPFAFEARARAALVAYEVGQWELSLSLTERPGEPGPVGAAAVLQAIRGTVLVGRGDPGAADELAAIRPHWAQDGWIVLLATGAQLDLHGYAGQQGRARQTYEEGTTFLRRLWPTAMREVELRLAGQLLGALVEVAHRAPQRVRSELLAHGTELLDEQAQVWAAAQQTHHDGPEARAWRTRQRAEHATLAWLAGAPGRASEDLVDLWRAAVAQFEEYGHALETVASRAGLAVALRAHGDPEAEVVREAARAGALALGASPWLARLGRPAAPAATATQTLGLTPREREILALVERGLSNREIGQRLFISPKTASVHVSNVLAKLGASGRGEAAAIARDRGLLAGD